MNHPLGRRLREAVPGLILASTLLVSAGAVHAANPPQQLGDFAHTSWSRRDGNSLGGVFAMAQTPDGYLWLASEMGLFRFDGEKFIPWQPPAGQSLPNSPYSLLVSRDGTLWMGTYYGFASWNGTQVTVYPELKASRHVAAGGPRRHHLGRAHPGRQRRALRNSRRARAVSCAGWGVWRVRLEPRAGRVRSLVVRGGHGTLAVETGTTCATTLHCTVPCFIRFRTQP